MKPLEEQLLENYENFSTKLTGGPCLQKGTEIPNFLKSLSKYQDTKSCGDWFAWYYVAFQFQYWYPLKTRMNGRIPLNWVFGTKALQRWLNRNEEWFYFTQKFIHDSEIVRPVEFENRDMEDIFEAERQRYFNTDLGFLHCSQSAKYDDQSPSCLICRHKKACKGLWK